MADPAACALCGLPSPPGPGLPFCCAGCRNVFEILSHLPEGPPADFRSTDLYRAGLEAGLLGIADHVSSGRQEGSSERGAGSSGNSSPGASGSPPSSNVSGGHGLGDPAPLEKGPPAVPSRSAAEELVLRVEGMWCPSCAWWIEEMLRRTEGVAEARVSFAADRATLRYLPQKASVPALLERVCALGYRASRLDDAPGHLGERSEVLRLGVSAILTANLMMLSMGLYGGFFADLGPSGVFFLSLPQLALATPVVFYGGLSILRRARLSVRAGTPSMDLLIAVGSLSAYGYSVAGLAVGSLHLYFDTAAVLVTLTLLGRGVEARLRRRATRGDELTEWVGRKACLLTREGERWVAAAAVKPGDEVRIRTGERIPTDGYVTDGRGRLDESTLTGEARPVACRPGSGVRGGTLLLEGELRAKASRTAADSAAGRMVAAMEEALDRKIPSELLAERLTRWLVPGVFFLTVVSAVWLRLTGHSMEEALVRSLTVLVITCPCALGVAIPLGKVAAVRSGRARGLLIRDPSALERIPGLDVIVFDKTGTLTEGSFVLRELALEGATREEALQRAASVALGSTHSLSLEIVRQAREQALPLDDLGEPEEVAGRGVRGLAGAEPTVLGNREWLDAQGMAVSPELAGREAELEARGWTTAWVGWKGLGRGVFAFGDRAKDDSARCVEELRCRGLSVQLHSGDSVGATAAIAGELGINSFVGRSLPEDKAAAVRDLRRAGHRVAFVGDGANDGPALAEADVGIALGGGPELCQAADVVILGRNPMGVVAALDHGRLATRVMRQNLFFAFAYNLLAVPLALSGLLNPILAALAMFASSLTVVVNTLRVTGLNGGRVFTDKEEAKKGGRPTVDPNSATTEVG